MRVALLCSAGEGGTPTLHLTTPDITGPAFWDEVERRPGMGDPLTPSELAAILEIDIKPESFGGRRCPHCGSTATRKVSGFYECSDCGGVF